MAPPSIVQMSMTMGCTVKASIHMTSTWPAAHVLKYQCHTNHNMSLMLLTLTMVLYSHYLYTTTNRHV